MMCIAGTLFISGSYRKFCCLSTGGGSVANQVKHVTGVEAPLSRAGRAIIAGVLDAWGVDARAGCTCPDGARRLYA